MKARIFTTFYSISLSILLLLTLPRFLYQMIFQKKYRKSWKQRLGIGVNPKIPTNKFRIWVHAVSVGEAKAVIPLIKKMNRDDIYWIISSLTETGYEEVKRSLDFPITQLFLPFDFRFIIRPLLKKIDPNLIIISETDLWYNFLATAHEHDVPIALVNGKISERSFNRLKKVPFFAHRLLSTISSFCVQDKIYADRFHKLGVPVSEIAVTGNLKWDMQIRPLKDPDAFRRGWGIDAKDKVIVIGSTHPKEEQLILDQLLPLLHQNPSLKLMVVPRHPERFSQVKQLITKYDSKQIILVDRMGILTDCYQIALIAILGGSFVPGVGGHNILEACQAGAGALFGPYMHNQEEMVSLVIEAGAGLQMPAESIYMTVETLLGHPQAMNEMKASGMALTRGLVGASNRTMEVVTNF